MKITVSVAQIKKWGACSGQVKVFQGAFGAAEVTVTRRKLHKAAALQLDIEWWFRRSMPDMYDDYLAKRKPLYDDYLAKRKPLYDDYLAKVNLLDDDHLAKKADLIADMLGLK